MEFVSEMVAGITPRESVVSANGHSVTRKDYSYASSLHRSSVADAERTRLELTQLSLLHVANRLFCPRSDLRLDTLDRDVSGVLLRRTGLPACPIWHRDCLVGPSERLGLALQVWHSCCMAYNWFAPD